jgi:hypothetical protein
MEHGAWSKKDVIGKGGKKKRVQELSLYPVL